MKTAQSHFSIKRTTPRTVSVDEIADIWRLDLEDIRNVVSVSTVALVGLNDVQGKDVASTQRVQVDNPLATIIERLRVAIEGAEPADGNGVEN